jgi:hypothetical protein
MLSLAARLSLKRKSMLTLIISDYGLPGPARAALKDRRCRASLHPDALGRLPHEPINTGAGSRSLPS